MTVFERLAEGEACEYTAPLVGTKFLFIGGTHGNEQTGIQVIRELAQRFESGHHRINKGCVRMVFGNPRAIAMNVRLSDNARDLNKSFTDTVLEGREDENYESIRAKTLATYIESSDVVIDIHSTQRPTARPFISAKIDTAHEAIYQWFNPPIDTVLQDPNYIFAGEPASSDEYADRCGAVGICLESGYAETSVVDTVIQGIENLLISHGTIEGRMSSQPSVPTQRFEWIESIPYDPKEGWEWAPGLSIRSFEHIPAGTVFGYVQGEAISRDFDVYLLFPKTDELRALENRVTYLARRID